jgi:hypothetical protein
MTAYEQIQQDIQTLPPEALALVAQFIQLLKKSQLAAEVSMQSSAREPDPAIAAPSETSESTKTIYAQFEDAGLIGCFSAEPDLSTNYKQILAEEWSRKHGHEKI